MSQRRINLAVLAILGICMVLGLAAASGSFIAQLAVVGIGSAVGADTLRTTK